MFLGMTSLVIAFLVIASLEKYSRNGDFREGVLFMEFSGIAFLVNHILKEIL